MRSARAGLSVGALVAVLAPGTAAAAPPSTDAPLHVVYDMAPIASALYRGAPGVPGLGSVTNSARQYPLGDPFPRDRWLGKVSHSELAPLSAGAMVRLLERRMKHSTLGPDLGARIVAIDEVGRQAQDDGFGPRLLAAMRIMAGQTDPATGQPMSRRVIMYIAPKMVANVGYHHQRGLWDAALAAAHLSGGVYLQMYHASGGHVTSVASAAEWRRDLPAWRRAMGGDADRVLRVLFTGGGPGQDAQWSWAAATAAGRSALRAGAGEYRLGSTDEAIAWLRNWNRFAR